MATTYNRRCGLCGQFVAIQDREALLTEHRFEWDESVVDDFIAGSRHDCTDTDPHGARASARLIEAGLIAPQLDWLIAAELERRRLAVRPAWAVLTGCVTPCGWTRPVQGRVCDHLSASRTGRSPPRVRA